MTSRSPLIKGPATTEGFFENARIMPSTAEHLMDRMLWTGISSLARMQKLCHVTSCYDLSCQRYDPVIRVEKGANCSRFKFPGLAQSPTDCEVDCSQSNRLPWQKWTWRSSQLQSADLFHCLSQNLSCSTNHQVLMSRAHV